jgi:hypothetical protein
MSSAVPSNGTKLRCSRMRNGRRQRMALAALLCLPALLLACRSQSADVMKSDDIVHTAIRAHKFVIVDDAGNERAELGALDDGRVRLTIRREGGKPAILIGLDENAQPVLDLADADGHVAAELGVYQDGQSWLMIQDPGRNLVARVGIDGRGRATFALEGANERPLAELGILAGEQEMSVFTLRDAEGRRRLGMTATKSGQTGMVLNDANGKERCTVRVDQDGQPQLKLWDDRGNPRASLMLYGDGACALELLDSANRQIRVSLVAEASDRAHLSVQDSEGHVIWTAPPSAEREDAD